MKYIINDDTCALIYVDNKTKVIDNKETIYLDELTLSVINRSCCYNASTFWGRKKGSSYLLGMKYKPPIIISETKKLILVPTHSERNYKCSWVVLSNVKRYKKMKNNKVEVEFKNNQKVKLDISYNIFDKQIIRATRLESILNGINN